MGIFEKNPMFGKLQKVHPLVWVGVLAIIFTGLYFADQSRKNALIEYDRQRNAEIKKVMEDETSKLNALTNAYQGDPGYQVAIDMESQYELVKSHGNETEMSVYAGMVATAYLQVKDEANYAKWKGIQNEHLDNLKK